MDEQPTDEPDEDTPRSGIVVPVPEGLVPDGEVVYAESVEAAAHWNPAIWRNGWR